VGEVAGTVGPDLGPGGGTDQPQQLTLGAGDPFVRSIERGDELGWIERRGRARALVRVRVDLLGALGRRGRFFVEHALDATEHPNRCL
jgi:hypothetical protein